MDLSATVTAACQPSAAVAFLSELERYPSWLSIVKRVEPVTLLDGDGGPAWSVELRARVGPLARSKRLRMVRAEQSERRVRFVRREADGRAHSAWVLDAEVTDGPPTTVAMHLHYGGSLWGPVLERLLHDEIERSRPRLVERLNALGEPTR